MVNPLALGALAVLAARRSAERVASNPTAAEGCPTLLMVALVMARVVVTHGAAGSTRTRRQGSSSPLPDQVFLNNLACGRDRAAHGQLVVLVLVVVTARGGNLPSNSGQVPTMAVGMEIRAPELEARRGNEPRRVPAAAQAALEAAVAASHPRAALETVRQCNNQRLLLRSLPGNKNRRSSRSCGKWVSIKSPGTKCRPCLQR